MASYTPNYNLKKPADADTYDIADANGNMDLIDTALHSQNEAIQNLNGSKVITVSDYNDLTTTGVYKAEATSNALHAPNPVSPGSWYVVSVWKTGVYITQIAHTPTYNRTYIRGYYTGAGWTDWQEFALKSETQKFSFSTIVTDFNSALESGIYAGNSATNSPITGWVIVLTMRLTDNNNYIAQIALQFGNNYMYIRTRENGTWKSWKNVSAS